MRLITFISTSGPERDSPRIGALVDSDRSVVDIQVVAARSNGIAEPAFGSMIALMEGGPAALDAARLLVDQETAAGGDAVIPVSEIRFLSPVPRPTQMRDFLCFEKHLRQAREIRYRRLADATENPEEAFADYKARGNLDPPQIWYDQPIYYTCNALAVVGTETDIVWPHFAEKMDYELEFGIFIGRGGSEIPKASARDYIFGYTIFNDISARDTQIKEMQGQLGPGKGKDFDTANVIGPCIVTTDEIGDPYDLVMTARVNGEELSRGNSGEMHHDFEDVIAYISRSTTLYPGEFIGSGTVGTGCGLEYDRYLEPGDQIELEIEKIGILKNTLVRPKTQPVN
jgi:2-keto-4-pentenoate hydratase/2-oxohepta-3-ene-1,7-dioic acid hydratase in catechol pathway